MGFITGILKDIPFSTVLRERLQELEKKHEKLEVENTQLKGENQRLKSKIKELTSSDELCENEVKILKLLSTNIGKKLSAGIISPAVGLSLTKTKYYLEKMRREYVHSRDYTTKRPSGYYLSQKGREYLVENDLLD